MQLYDLLKKIKNILTSNHVVFMIVNVFILVSLSSQLTYKHQI